MCRIPRNGADLNPFELVAAAVSGRRDRTGVVVQARQTSTRLPGKVLLPLGGATVLANVLKRCAAIPGVDVVCCAIPEGGLHDAIAAEAEANGATVVRGSERDVLARYDAAAAALDLGTVLRVTSDCPLIDPDLCGHVLSLLYESRADYACNNLPPSWPHGLDVEAFTRSALALAAASTADPHDREHVTPWLRRAETLVRRTLPGPGGRVAQNRWTLDYPEDYAFLCRLYDHLAWLPRLATTEDVLEVLARHPGLADINRDRHDAARDSAIDDERRDAG